MGDFLRSTRFKILVAVFIVLFSFMLRAAYTGGAVPMTTQLINIVTTPLQKISSGISNSVTGVFRKYLQAGQIEEENEELKERIRILNQQMADYEKNKQENEQFREFLEMKENNPDIELESASVIMRDSSERFYSFTIDKGSYHGVSKRDPVITPDGLVGVISEVYLTSSKVQTILDVGLEVGAFDITTRDIGIVTGRIDLAREGQCHLTLLPRESESAPGNLVYTSGYGGLFPQGLCVGEIVRVETENHGMSLYAVINPAADISGVKNVLVITAFQGQGEQIPED